MYKYLKVNERANIQVEDTAQVLARAIRQEPDKGREIYAQFLDELQSHISESAELNMYKSAISAALDEFISYYYKVVKRGEDGELTSCLAQGEARVIYKPGEWVSAPPRLAQAGYDLTVFDSLSCLSEFLTEEPGDIEIWAVEVRGLRRSLPPMLHRPDLPPDAPANNKGYRLDWPRGTCMAEKIKLARKLQRQELEEYGISFG